MLVEIMDVQPFQDQPWGFTGVFDRTNGGGFLDEIYPSAAKAIWDFEGKFQFVLRAKSGLCPFSNIGPFRHLMHVKVSMTLRLSI